MNWNNFPQRISTVEASAIDPHGSFTTILSTDRNFLSWKNSIIGYKIPATEKILVAPYPHPIIAIFIWLFALGFYLIIPFHTHQQKRNRFGVALFFIGLIIYLFFRVEAILPGEIRSVGKSDQGMTITQDLLSNVYRAINRREENDVYDCLVNNVTENQLSDIYIENRKGMVMEDRGGARANVDGVKVLEIYDIRKAEEGNHEIDVKWTVNGSVNHFGHTHYRQNQYRALVSIVEEDEVWKINGIESYDIERIY